MVSKHMTFPILIGLVFLVSDADSIRCYECRSDVLRSCGDPFFPLNVPAVECAQQSTQPALMCFKGSQYGMVT